MIKFSCKRFSQNVVYKRTLPTAANASNTNYFTERNSDVYILQIMTTRASNYQPAPIRSPPSLRNGNIFVAYEKLSSYALFTLLL